jgi:hypothetical protein
MDTHLYLVCYKYDALVASHLPPEEFAPYMAVGLDRRTNNRVMFIEIDPAKLDRQALDLEKGLSRCVPHEDGSPKRSCYVCIYRALERVPREAMGPLYLTTRDGHVLGLDPQDYREPHKEDSHIEGQRMFVELCPMQPRVVSTLSPGEYGTVMTDPSEAVHVPRLLFCDCKIDRDPGGRLAGYLPYSDHAHIEDCLDQLQNEGKQMKIVDRHPSLRSLYRTIAHGFYVADQAGTMAYYLPEPEQLNDKYYTWWRSAQAE